jgi:uroporphyrinogen-III synthase
MRRLTILSTKKLIPAIIKDAAKEGIEIIEQEAIKIEPISTGEKCAAIACYYNHTYAVFTSANAVTSVYNCYVSEGSATPLSWKIFSLAGKTKDSILNLNPFSCNRNLIGEAIDAVHLAKEIIRQGVKEIVFFCGDKRRNELPTMLKDAGVLVHEVVVYKTVETPMVATENINAVLFFSPSAVHSFFKVNQLKMDTVCFAIGHTTAAAIKEYSTNKIVISNTPTQASMLHEVTDYFKNLIHH